MNSTTIGPTPGCFRKGWENDAIADIIQQPKIVMEINTPEVVITKKRNQISAKLQQLSNILGHVWLTPNSRNSNDNGGRQTGSLFRCQRFRWLKLHFYHSRLGKLDAGNRFPLCRSSAAMSQLPPTDVGQFRNQLQWVGHGQKCLVAVRMFDGRPIVFHVWVIKIKKTHQECIRPLDFPHISGVDIATYPLHMHHQIRND